jgi:hypothetical protein
LTENPQTHGRLVDALQAEAWKLGMALRRPEVNRFAPPVPLANRRLCRPGLDSMRMAICAKDRPKNNP